MKYKILALLGAPGVILHELGHLFFCLISGVRVFRVKLFGFGNPAGYVEHGEPGGIIQSTLISFGPLTFNSFVSLIMFSKINWHIPEPVQLIYLWIGLTSALHAIPSNGDASTLFRISKNKLRRNPLALLALPFVLIIYILNFLKRFHLHLLYVAVLFYLGNIYLK